MSTGLRAGTNNDGYLQVNGTDVLTALSSGNIGIGTDTPLANLHIESSAYPTLKLQNTSGASGFPVLQIINNISGQRNYQIENGRDSGCLQIRDNSAAVTRLTLTSGGNVGIGTTNPGVKLHVVTGSSGGSVYPLSSAVIEGSSYGYLDIKGTASCGINFGDAAAAQAGTIEYNHSSDFLRFITASGERLRINSSGNVGIGTDNPLYLLHLKSNGSAGILIQADADNIDETHTASIVFAQDGGNTEQFKIGLEGVAGTEFTNSVTNAAYIHANNTASQPLQFAHNGAHVMTLQSGKVGVGTTQPHNSSILNVHSNTTDSTIIVTSTRNSSFGYGTLSTYPWDANASVTNFGANSLANTVYSSAVTRINSNYAAWSIQARISNSLYENDDNIRIVRTTTSGTDSDILFIKRYGDVEIVNGNLKFNTSGKGIDFSATADGSGTTDSELLDDYEEGTFTPGFGVSNGNITYSTQWGKYTKVGNVVYIWFRMIATNDANASLYYLTNLPFTVGGVNGQYPGPCISNFYNLNIGSNATVLGGYWRHGEARFRFHSNGNNTNQLTPTLTASSSFEIRGEGFYPVS